MRRARELLRVGMLGRGLFFYLSLSLTSLWVGITVYNNLVMQVLPPMPSSTPHPALLLPKTFSCHFFPCIS